MTALRFLEPLGVLFLRGNKLFGAPGSYGDAQMPPNPSVAAGAIRSRILADDHIDLTAFARGEVSHPDLGTPQQPGEFALTAFHLARRKKDGAIEPLFAPPADLVLTANEQGDVQPQVHALHPREIAHGIQSSYPLAQHPVLAQKQRSKPVSGYWLTVTGWQAVLRGELPTSTQHWLPVSELWRVDERVGIGMDAATGSVVDGGLFTTQAIALKPDIGFLVAVSGAEPPEEGSLRFGGDGRAVAIRPADVHLPEPDYAALVKDRRCRIILTTPGIFPQGWLPTGASPAEEGTANFALHGVRGKITAAAVSRFETVSGWDLAQWQPKPAERCAPVGSVYWLDELDATEADLRKLAETGLWLTSGDNPGRRAEGFNCCALAAWHHEGGN
jgi:CRISPR-associated protein Cmr3